MQVKLSTSTYSSSFFSDLLYFLERILFNYFDFLQSRILGKYFYFLQSNKVIYF